MLDGRGGHPLTGAMVLAAAAGGVGAAAALELVAWRVVVARARRGQARRGRGLPAAGIAVVARVGRRIGWRPGHEDLGDRLAAAGAPLGLAAADVVALKTGGAVLGAAVALVLAPTLPGRLWVAASLVAPAAGFLAPETLLARRARRRGAAMALEVADVLDLLRVAVEAGMPAGRALGEVGRRRRGLLAAELRRAAGEMALGEPRAEALGRLARRCPLPEAAALVAAVGRADRHGAPLGPALEALAAEARSEQARRVREAAARAVPKIQLVVALVLVPAVMLLVAAALVHALAAG